METAYYKGICTAGGIHNGFSFLILDAYAVIILRNIISAGKKFLVKLYGIIGETLRRENNDGHLAFKRYREHPLSVFKKRYSLIGNAVCYFHICPVGINICSFLLFFKKAGSFFCGHYFFVSGIYAGNRYCSSFNLKNYLIKRSVEIPFAQEYYIRASPYGSSSGFSY